MTKYITCVSVATVLGLAGTAQAMPGAVIADQGRKLADLYRDPHLADGAVKTCREEVAKAMSELEPDDFVRSDSFAVLAKAVKDDYGWRLEGVDAMSICDDMAKFEPLQAPLKVLDGAMFQVKFLPGVLTDWDYPITDDRIASVVATEEGCRPALATMKAAGLKKVVLSETDVELATADKQVCDALTDLVVQYKQAKVERDEAHRKWWEEAAAPYKKVGIDGEKLEYLVSAEGIAIYGIGGKELTTPKQKKAAKVTFEVWTADDGSVTIKRQKWKGNKADSWSQKTYPVRPGKSAFK
jgi:hypothetical protein